MTIVTAADFADGMSHSLRAGLAAAAGGMGRGDHRARRHAGGRSGDLRRACRGGDATGSRRRPDVARQARQPGRLGPRALAAAGGADRRRRRTALLSELGDQIDEIAVADPGVLADVDTPEALAALRGGISAMQWLNCDVRVVEGSVRSTACPASDIASCWVAATMPGSSAAAVGDAPVLATINITRIIGRRPGVAARSTVAHHNTPRLGDAMPGAHHRGELLAAAIGGFGGVGARTGGANGPKRRRRAKARSGGHRIAGRGDFGGKLAVDPRRAEVGGDPSRTEAGRGQAAPARLGEDAVAT